MEVELMVRGETYLVGSVASQRAEGGLNGAGGL